MKAVILAGGLGTRLKPFTEVIPKPLLPIGEKSVLEIQIGRLKESGFDEIILATNYKADYIRRFFNDGSDFGVTLTVSKEEKALGTAGPLSLLKDRLTEPFIVMNGDILTQLDFKKMYDFSVAQKSHMTVGVKKYITPYQFGNILFEGDFISKIEEKPDMVNYIVSGIYVLKPEIFSWIPENQYFGMDQLITSLLSEKSPVTKYEIEEYWLDIGRLTDYESAQEVYNTHFKDESSLEP